jgi:hypothetical protein
VRTQPALAASLALWIGVLSAAVRGQDGPAPRPSPSPSPSRDPPTTIYGSVDRVVKRYLDEHEPCLRERDSQKDKGVPCFPVLVEQTREESVAESFRRWRTDVRPGSGSPPPTTPAGTPIMGISVDPCTLKSLFKGIAGRTDRYYLYRVFDTNGEGAILRENRIEPGTHGAFATYQYELVKEIKGYCEALAAWRALNREIWARIDAARKR